MFHGCSRHTVKKLNTFMKPVGSLPCSLEASTGAYYEPVQSSPPSFLTIYFKITLVSSWSVLLRFSDQSFLCNFISSITATSFIERHKYQQITSQFIKTVIVILIPPSYILLHPNIFLDSWHQPKCNPSYFRIAEE